MNAHPAVDLSETMTLRDGSVRPRYTVFPDRVIDWKVSEKEVDEATGFVVR